MVEIVIIGGGAAGFFAALAAKEVDPHSRVILLEKTGALLSKVRISGGGRCNVTHACFDPKQLVLNYPRGNKELIGPFSRFQPTHTIQWFAERGVELKSESDGRMFPISDSSSTIIDCLMSEARRLKVEIQTKQRIEKIEKVGDRFHIQLATGEKTICDRLLLATGSYPDGYGFAKQFGHSIQAPVPSLFTFNVPSSPLHDLAGISVNEATLKLVGTGFEQRGALLITHWGFSGPAALKLSAWAARALHACNYRLSLSIDWIPQDNKEGAIEQLRKMRRDCPGQALSSKNPFLLPKNLWKRLVALTSIEETKKWSDVGNEPLNKLCERLKGDIYQVEGKTTYKEEFVTCGGVVLQEINFKIMESRLCKGLFFAGEILDIDGVTGGFNFQSAWTTGWLAAQGMTHNRPLA